MRKPLLIFISSLFLIAFYGCNSTPGQKKSTSTVESPSEKLIVYGSTNCSHCKVFIKKLDSAGIDYDFRNVHESDDYYMEVHKKLKEAKYTSGRYPVLDINGKIHVSATFKKYLKIVSGEN